MLDRFRLGVCHYPEHWPASKMESDFRRMRDAGIDLVRMGEGAWSYWEPREGEFQFDLFDRAIELCGKHGIQVILGTPTYCGPAWVAEKYPQTLRWDFNRRVMAHGSRRNFNYTSPDYLRLSDRICTALAEHYRDAKPVIAWQLDNEFNCHMDVSYAPSDTLAFRQWLRQKYRTLGALNQAWGTKFWSQVYDDWEQIDLPAPTSAPLNPSVLLDESRFLSDYVVRFAARQAKILRSFNKRWQITHNGLFSNVNGPDLMGALDFFSHDQYPLFAADWPARADSLVQARSLSFPYGILEHQSGPGGQLSYLQRMPRPGEIRLWSWQSVAHGSSFVSFFLWRTCPFGVEMHWHGLLDQDNRDTRRLAEAKLTGEEMRKLPGDFFAAAPVKRAAVLRDYDNEINERRINTYTKSGAGEHSRWMAALARRHIPVDYVWPASSWAGYSVLIAPHQKIVTEALQKKLEQFVQSGGTLVLGAQAGFKDINGHIVQKTAPGLLAKLAGIEVEDWSTVADGKTQRIRLDSGKEIHCMAFVERLRLMGAQPMARWVGEDTLLEDAPAITCNRVGKGTVIYVGGYCDIEAIGEICEHLLALKAVIAAGPGVEVVLRKGKRGFYLLLLNHDVQAQRVTGLPGGKELVSGNPVRGELRLPGFGVAVIASKSLK